MLARVKSFLKRPSAPPEFRIRELRRLLGRPDPVILEIGCNDGSDTLKFLRAFERPTVYCFEPDPRARERFRRKVSSDSVRLFDLALSDKDGTAEFYPSGGHPSESWRKRLPRGWDYSGSLRRPKAHLDAHPWCTFGETLAVPTMRLDTWSAAHAVGRVDFIWADVQGAEGDLIRGGIETLRRTRYLFTEYNDAEMYEGQITLGEMLRLLPDFRLLRKYPNDALLENACLATRPVLPVPDSLT